MGDRMPRPRQLDNYPQGTRLPQPKSGTSRAQPSFDTAFPPHPSVRIPPNVRAATRQVPAGVGVAPRPGRRPQGQKAQLHSPPSRPLNAAQTVQNINFPHVPPPIPDSDHDLAPPNRGRYNMHDSYISSVNDDSDGYGNATPKTASSPKSKTFPTPPRASSVYPGTEYPSSPAAAYPSSRIMPASEFSTPAPSRGNDSNADSSHWPPRIATEDLNVPIRPRMGEISPASSRTTAMNALTAAIAAGFSQHPQSSGASNPPSRTFSPMRMPFEVNGSPPRTPDALEALEAPKLRDAPMSGKSLEAPNSAVSQNSSNPLLGLGIDHKGMSSKVPVTKRPPRLDIDAVRDMETRGSTTSLAELIRRATKLASNLDRGKTASRFGMLDMLGSSEKLGRFDPGNRDSSMSDLMSAFPAPAAGGTPRRDTTWPLGEKGYADEHDQSAKAVKSNKRKCCGMSLPVFIAVAIIVLVLIAAAVLLPVFLIIIPRQQEQHIDFSRCPTTYRCENLGTSIVSNNACGCVCSNGFVGTHCNMLGSRADCTTQTLSDGPKEYQNATMGRSLVPVFLESDSRFAVPLNASSILSLFALNSLSCISENQLVDFNGTSSVSPSSKIKRFVVVPDMMAESTPTPTAAPLLPRQDVDSSNGIVFQASTTATPSAASSNSNNVAVSTVTSFSNPAAPTQSASFEPLDVPENLVLFARAAVLYVLQESNSISLTVNAQQRIQSYFLTFTTGTDPGSDVVDLGFGDFKMTADFKKLEIKNGSGKIVAGG